MGLNWTLSAIQVEQPEQLERSARQRAEGLRMRGVEACDMCGRPLAEHDIGPNPVKSTRQFAHPGFPFRSRDPFLALGRIDNTAYGHPRTKFNRKLREGFALLGLDS